VLEIRQTDEQRYGGALGTLLVHNADRLADKLVKPINARNLLRLVFLDQLASELRRKRINIYFTTTTITTKTTTIIIIIIIIIIITTRTKKKKKQKVRNRHIYNIKQRSMTYLVDLVHGRLVCRESRCLCVD
jgi:hypothetical protein